MSRILREAIHVDGAEYIGSAHGYDVFDILTYAAAQEFRIENRDHEAGAAYTQNESTFNANINDSQHLYFFALENTNQVYGAIVKSDSTHGDVTFVGQAGEEITIGCNFLYENAGENSSKTYYNKPLPFFLVPGTTFEGQCPEIDCLCVEEGILVAALIQFADIPDGELLALDNMPRQIESISSTAFNFGIEVDVIKLDDHIEALPAHCMDKVHNSILVTALEVPFHWDPEWNAGKENITTLGFGADPEEVARIEREREAARQAELEREEQRRREEEEAARIAAEREARKLRYKIKGKEVIITGTVSGISELTIPEEIQGLPVTTIAAYAFYDEEDLTRVILPKTLKMIEKAAFYRSGVRRITIPKNCVVGKYNDNLRITRE